MYIEIKTCLNLLNKIQSKKSKHKKLKNINSLILKESESYNFYNLKIDK